MSADARQRGEVLTPGVVSALDAYPVEGGAAPGSSIVKTQRLAWHLGACGFCRSRETGPGCDEGEALVEHALSDGAGAQLERRWGS